MNTVKKRVTTQFDLTKNALNNLSQYNITPTAKLVLLYLTDCYNPNHADVFPKQKTIALKLGISERSVVRAIQELFKASLILIECKTTNRYILMLNSTSQLSQNDKLSQTECQNNTFTPDNLSPSYIEQTKLTKKQQTESFKSGGNVYLGDDKILADYAIKHNAKNIKAYIAKLKETKSAEKIIKESKKRYNPIVGFKITEMRDKIRIKNHKNSVGFEKSSLAVKLSERIKEEKKIKALR